MKINTYAVNCNDAWLNTEGDDISGSYVKYKDHQEVVAALEAKCAALAAENAALKQSEKEFNNFCRQEYYGWEDNFTKTPATDAFLAEVRAQGVEMFAIWNDKHIEKGDEYEDVLDEVGKAARGLAEKLRQNSSSDMPQCAEPETDNTNQQFESLSRDDK